MRNDSLILIVILYQISYDGSRQERSCEPGDAFLLRSYVSLQVIGQRHKSRNRKRTVSLQRHMNHSSEEMGGKMNHESQEKYVIPVAHHKFGKHQGV